MHTNIGREQANSEGEMFVFEVYFKVESEFWRENSPPKNSERNTGSKFCCSCMTRESEGQSYKPFYGVRKAVSLVV